MSKQWNELSDDQKTSVMREFIKKVGLEDFDYTKAKQQRERLIEAKEDMVWSYYSQLENPCLSLNLIDPVLTNLMSSWMYHKSSEFGITIPLMGYELEKITFSKSTLMQYSDEEKQILNAAMDILKKKGVDNAKF